MTARRVLAEYRDGAELIAAIRALRARGYQRLEAYTPFPLPAVDDALGARPSRLSIAVLIGAVVGAGGAYFLQWLINVYLYPLDVGGRPLHFPLAFVPITFEMGVLVAAFTAVGAVLVAGRLLRLWHPVFEADGFGSASEDGWWLELVTDDPAFDAARTERELRETGAVRVTSVGDEP